MVPVQSVGSNGASALDLLGGGGGAGRDSGGERFADALSGQMKREGKGPTGSGAQQPERQRDSASGEDSGSKPAAESGQARDEAGKGDQAKESREASRTEEERKRDEEARKRDEEERKKAEESGKNSPLPLPLLSGEAISQGKVAVDPEGELKPSGGRRAVPLAEQVKGAAVAGKAEAEVDAEEGDFAGRLLERLGRGRQLEMAGGPGKVGGERSAADPRTLLGALQSSAGRESATPQPPAFSVPSMAPQSALPGQPTVAVSTPVQQQGWDSALGERVIWMARQNVQQAQIQLNPRELGPVEVRVSVNNDQATVHFSAHNPATRDALEAAMPRLREMMQESGLNLAQSDVNRDGADPRGQSGESASGGGGRGGDVPGEEALAEGESVERGSEAAGQGGVGMVDYFA